MAWLERTSPETGARFIAIPHNSNTSGGLMFEETDSDGRPITVDYARTRARWEPVVEVTQVKGDSETHPVLSPTDEFADFERYRWFFTGEPLVARPGGFVRSALLRGLALEAELGVNPYKLGMIGSSDAHMGYSEVSESNFSGKFPIDSIPENKRVKIGVVPLGWELSSTGLAAVWAEENTREALFQAFQRREVYATTGTRLRVRFFGGWSFDEEDASARDLAEIGYRRGVPMGGDLTAVPEGSSPSFLVQAVKDPLAANLDRVQIVKGWLDDQGNVHEKIYDVAWAGDRAPDADGHLSAVGNTVDISTARYANTIGAIELATTWADPDFNPNERAFYYVRVLEIQRRAILSTMPSHSASIRHRTSPPPSRSAPTPRPSGTRLNHEAIEWLAIQTAVGGDHHTP